MLFFFFLSWCLSSITKEKNSFPSPCLTFRIKYCLHIKHITLCPCSPKLSSPYSIVFTIVLVAFYYIIYLFTFIFCHPTQYKVDNSRIFSNLFTNVSSAPITVPKTKYEQNKYLLKELIGILLKSSINFGILPGKNKHVLPN